MEFKIINKLLLCLLFIITAHTIHADNYDYKTVDKLHNSLNQIFSKKGFRVDYLGRPSVKSLERGQKIRAFHGVWFITNKPTISLKDDGKIVNGSGNEAFFFKIVKDSKTFIQVDGVKVFYTVDFRSKTKLNLNKILAPLVKTPDSNIKNK